jgi:hypothetical protein
LRPAEVASEKLHAAVTAHEESGVSVIVGVTALGQSQAEVGAHEVPVEEQPRAVGSDCGDEVAKWRYAQGSTHDQEHLSGWQVG